MQRVSATLILVKVRRCLCHTLYWGEIGPRAAVFENPQHDYTKKLIATGPAPDPARRGIRRGLPESEEPRPPGPLQGSFR